jgi:hypothetical protein
VGDLVRALHASERDDHPITLEMFVLGLDGYQEDAQLADFWIDDLSVTPQRVGCQAASG